MFVGETGVGRIVQRSCEVMNELKTDDPERIRAAGAIDLPLLQKFINFHFSISVDLFGQEVSTNAATYFNQGLKGRYHESEIDGDDHVLADATWPVHTIVGDRIELVGHPAVNAVNERLRQEYIDDCLRGMQRWNQTIKRAKIDFEFGLPHRAFHRAIGNFADTKLSPKGKVVTEADWTRHQGDWLPSDDDHAFVQSLMTQVLEPGKMAGWIAPPNMGVNREDPDEFQYIKFN